MELRDEFYSWVILPDTHSVGGCIGPTAHLDALEKRKLFPPSRNRTTVSWLSNPWPCHYTECATPNPGSKSKIQNYFKRNTLSVLYWKETINDFSQNTYMVLWYMFWSLYDEVTNVLCVSLLSHDRYQYHSLILSSDTGGLPDLLALH